MRFRTSSFRVRTLTTDCWADVTVDRSVSMLKRALITATLAELNSAPTTFCRYLFQLERTGWNQRTLRSGDPVTLCLYHPLRANC
jgi:hypothetical protein